MRRVVVICLECWRRAPLASLLPSTCVGGIAHRTRRVYADTLRFDPVTRSFEIDAVDGAPQ